MALGVIAGALWGLDATTEKTTVTQPKIIVLPFANLSEDPARQFFSDGLSEDISSKLSRFPGLTIVPASVTHEVAGSDPMALGRELNANYIISGSVRQSGDQVRITTQLIDLGSGNQVWADSYDRELTAANLFSVQADVAQRVVANVGDPTGVLNRVAAAAIRDRPTDSLEAYECVLRGYAYLRIHDDKSHALARDCLEQAVKLDPGYAEAWAQLAYLYREEYHHNRNARPDPLGRAEQAAQRALDLGAANAMLSFALSMIAFSREDVTAGLAYGDQAAQLNPNNAIILAAVAIYYAQCGNVEGALELGRRVRSIHPNAPRWLHMVFATAYYLRGEYDQSLEAVALWNQPNDVQWHYQRTANLAQLGRLPEARAALDEMLDTYPKFAADPVTELRKYMLVEETVEPFLDGLAKAGLEIPNTP
jgi:TolB-like protein/Tfp pilus assembly protein PilF